MLRLCPYLETEESQIPSQPELVFAVWVLTAPLERTVRACWWTSPPSASNDDQAASMEESCLCELGSSTVTKWVSSSKGKKKHSGL